MNDSFYQNIINYEKKYLRSGIPATFYRLYYALLIVRTGKPTRKDNYYDFDCYLLLKIKLLLIQTFSTIPLYKMVE